MPRITKWITATLFLTLQIYSTAAAKSLTTREPTTRTPHNDTVQCSTGITTELMEEVREMLRAAVREEVLNITNTKETVVVDYDRFCSSVTPTAKLMENGTTATPKNILATPKLPTLITPNSKNPNCTVGRSPDKPADSCRHILKCDCTSKSGYYYLKVYPTLSSPTVLLLYCHMELDKCGIRGLIRIADFNMGRNETVCPHALKEVVQSGKRFCIGRSTTATCDSIILPTYGIKHSRVCGKAVGYSRYYGNAFHYNTRGINDPYVDGIAITSGPHNNREHVWTYAIGYKESSSSTTNCPCAAHPGRQPQLFVGSNYYCDNASNSPTQKWYVDKPLWTGKGCYTNSKCCNSSRIPWFWKTLFDQTDEDIEVRFCRATGVSLDVGLKELEMYIY